MGGDWHFLERAAESGHVGSRHRFGRRGWRGSAPYGRRAKVTHARAATRGGVRAWAPRALQMTVQIEPRLVQGQHTRAGYFSLRLSTTTRTTTAAALTHILARSKESRELDAKINRAARAPLESLSLLGCLRAGRLCR